MINSGSSSWRVIWPNSSVERRISTERRPLASRCVRTLVMPNISAVSVSPYPMREQSPGIEMVNSRARKITVIANKSLSAKMASGGFLAVRIFLISLTASTEVGSTSNSALANLFFGSKCSLKDCKRIPGCRSKAVGRAPSKRIFEDLLLLKKSAANSLPFLSEVKTREKRASSLSIKTDGI